MLHLADISCAMHMKNACSVSRERNHHVRFLVHTILRHSVAGNFVLSLTKIASLCYYFAADCAIDFTDWVPTERAKSPCSKTSFFFPSPL